MGWSSVSTEPSHASRRAMTRMHKALNGSWLLLAPALVASLVFFVAPLCYLIVESFVHFSSFGPSEGYTLAHYKRILTDPYYIRVIITTFRLAAITTLCCLVLGYPVAILLRAASARFKGFLIVAVIAPLLVSSVVRTFGWMIVLGENGFLNSILRQLGIGGEFTSRSHLFNEVAVIIGLIHLFIPFMILAIYGSLQKQPKNLVNAAKNLGASPLRAFVAVTVPISLPGIISGTMTVFALSAGAYVTVAVLGGSKIMVLSILSYQQSIGLGNWPFGAAIGIVLLVGTLAIMQLFQVAMRCATVRDT